jgi:PKD repeat protein
MTTRVYYHITATEALGLSINSTDRWLIVDDELPVLTYTGFSPTYPNATDPSTVYGTANDGFSSMDVYLDYKYGVNGTVKTIDLGKGGHNETVVRNPVNGTTTSTLSAYYYAPTGSVMGRITLRVYAADHAGVYVRMLGYRGGSATTLVYSSSTSDGIKYDQDVQASNFDRIYVYFYDRSRSHTYYHLTYTTVDTDYTTSIPAPGSTTLVYYRFRGVDQVGNTNSTNWTSYYADGTKPYLSAHKPPGVKSSTVDVSIGATFTDESRMDKAQLFYSYGTEYQWVNMGQSYYNGTHLGATASIPRTSIPIEVKYYFVFFDSAGNNKTSKVYKYRTKMRDITEGALTQFDSSVLKSKVGITSWEWDFDYNGTFDVDKSGQIVMYRYNDNGTYTISLKLTLNDGNITQQNFTVTVIDAHPSSTIRDVGTVVEGTNVSLDGSFSRSYPDPIVSFEWDLSYDGMNFNVEATGMIYNHTFMSDGTYRVALKVTDDDGSTAISDIYVTVTDGRPELVIDYLSTVDEGTMVVLNATGTISWPDALDRIDWDLDYRGTWSKDATGLVINHTYMDNGTYRFMARAHDADGSMTQMVGTITVRDLAPVANITAASQVDEGSVLDLDGTATHSYPDEIVSYEWDFRYTGTFDIDARGNMTNVTYMDNGTYTVALRVTDDDGSVTIVTWDVTVMDLAPRAVIIAPPEVDEGEVVKISTNASSHPDRLVRIDWDFYYDGSDFKTDDNGFDVEHTYMDNGTYTLAVRVTDDDGSVIIEVMTIIVYDLGPEAIAAVSGDYTEGSNLIIDARPSKSYPDEIVLFEWDLDYDGTTFNVDMTGDVNEPIYMDHGTYTLALRITDDDGSQSIHEQTFEITDLGPTADLAVTVLFHSEGDLVTFSAIGSESYPDELVAYHWDWDGDGEVDETTDLGDGKHIFNKPNVYDVELTVEDDDGSTDSTTVTITITDVAPIARLEAVATPEGEPVLLDASGTIEPGSDFVAFRWDLDGDMAWDVEDTCSTLEHVWNDPGMYEITMQVEDEDGSKASKGITLVIQDVAPVADTGGPYEFLEGDPVVMDASASHEPGRDFTSFKWDLDGDGGYDAEGMELNWTFTLAGEYTITLLVEDEDGSTGEATSTLVVIDKDPEFTISLPENVMENVAAEFSLIGLTDPGTEKFDVTWYLGDGNSKKGPTIEHIYLEEGSYKGRVEVGDNDGTVVTVPWPSPLTVSNSAPVVELSTTVLKATEDSEFTLSVFGHDTVNDNVTYDFKGPGGKIDESTGAFKWTPLDEHVGKNKFTFIARDDDGGEGTLEVEIDVKDVDNDYFGLPFATFMAILIAIILAVVIAFFVVMRQRKQAAEEVIEAEEKVDLEGEVEVEMDEAAKPPAKSPAEEGPKPLPEGAPEGPPDLDELETVSPAITEGPPKKRPPEGRPPPKKRPPGAPPRKKRPPGAPPRKKRPPGAPPPKKRPPGAPPRKKRPPGAPPPKKRPPGAPPRKKRPPGAPPRKKRPPGAPPPKKRPPGERPPPKKRPPDAPPRKRKKRPPAP